MAGWFPAGCDNPRADHRSIALDECTLGFLTGRLQSGLEFVRDTFPRRRDPLLRSQRRDRTVDGHIRLARQTHGGTAQDNAINFALISVVAHHLVSPDD